VSLELHFDPVTSPLEADAQGVIAKPLLIEAGAGSGKTWTLANLAVRFMMEQGVAPEQILMVTFTREAASELKGRVRLRLEQVLAMARRDAFSLTTVSSTKADEVHFAQRWCDPELRAADTRRLEVALATLDGLQASTIHSFAAASVGLGASLSAESDELLDRANRLVRARWSLQRRTDFEHLRLSPPKAGKSSSPSKSTKWDKATAFTVLASVAKAMFDAGVRDGKDASSVVVLPSDAGADATGEELRARLQRAYAYDVVREYEALLRQAGVMSYADLLVRLQDRVQGDGAARFVQEMRDRFRVVMIDEFQDTDPFQWSVFDTLFATAADTWLILVGDPKQAIYAFRGGSVDTFLQVRDDQAKVRATLPANRRTQARLLNAVDVLFRGIDFNYRAYDEVDHSPISYTPPQRIKEARTPGVTDFGRKGAPLHLRTTAKGVGEAKETILAEVVAYVRRAHASGVAYSEIAVLANNNTDCLALHRALKKEGIPATTGSERTVFSSDAAQHVRVLLHALASPSDAALANALQLTWFGAVASGEVAIARVEALLTLFASSGVNAVTRHLRSHDVLTAAIEGRDGERNVTDLQHLTELLATECREIRSLAGVRDWLDECMVREDAENEFATRRLETDSQSVRVMTVHKSKGLEFEVVLLPFVGKAYHVTDGKAKNFLRRWEEGGATYIDAGSFAAWGDETDRRRKTEAAHQGESRRLLYVAVTRAKGAVVLWHARSGTQPYGYELRRLLLDREVTEDGSSTVCNRTIQFIRDRLGAETKDAAKEAKRVNDPSLAVSWQEEQHLLLEQFFGHEPDIEAFTIGDDIPSYPGQAGGDVDAFTVDYACAPPVVLDYETRRWSYSDVKKSLATFTPAPPTGSADDDNVGGADEEDDSVGATAPTSELERPAVGIASVFGNLRGKELGVAVHRALELAAGVAEPPFAALVERALREGGLVATASEQDRARVAASLDAVWRRPLPLGDAAVALSASAREDIATEMRFLMSVGDAYRDDRLERVVDAIRRLDTSADGTCPHEAFLNRAGAFRGQLSEGFMVGSLDVVVRLGDGSYRIIDYKTDQWAGAERPYRAERMRQHIEEQGYVLQAIFYAIALHRYLAAALLGYDPQRHLGGVDFYFVRVVGDDTARSDDGYLHWAITPDAIVAASEALGDLP
jgi:exodeoxyribonuclease V beta subunit